MKTSASACDCHLDAARAILAQAAKAMGCEGWEVVCPDGRVRHYPFHNRGDAKSTAELAAKKCRMFTKASPLERVQPPCPGGTHTVQPIDAALCGTPEE